MKYLNNGFQHSGATHFVRTVVQLATAIFLIASSVFTWAAPTDVTFQNGGPALLGNPVTFDGVTYSHDAPATGKMARYNDSVDSVDRFGIIDSANTDNGLLYHMSDSGTIDAPIGDIDFRFKTADGSEFRLVSMEAGSITDLTSVSGSVNHAVTITGYKDNAAVIFDVIDFTTADSNGSVTYTKNAGYNDGVLTFDSNWQNIDEVRFTTTGKSAMKSIVIIDTIDFEPAVTPTVPGAPTIGTATAGDTQASVSFSAPASDGGSTIIGYTATSTPGGLTGACSASPCTVTGLSNGTAYTFTVTAINAVGTGSPSAASNSVTPKGAPGAPTIGTATAGDTQASVTFSAPANDGGSTITGYTATSSPGGLTGACSASPCTVTGLSNGTAYTFTVTATNAVGTGSPSAASNSVTPDVDSDGDGKPDSSDDFPTDPIEDTDSDNDGIGDNGDAGGAGIGIKVLSAASGCTFNGAVQNGSSFLTSAPGVPLDRQLSFSLSGCGSSVVIEAHFGATLPAGSVAYKVSSAGEWTVIPGASISGNRITYTLTDNGPLDENPASGEITDPVTSVVPAAIATPTSIPALPLYALLMLGSLVGFLGCSRFPWTQGRGAVMGEAQKR